MSGQMPDLGQYFRAVWKRTWLVLIVIVIAIGAAYWVMGRRPARYTTSATLLVTAAVIAPTPSAATGGADTSYRPQPGTIINDMLQLFDSRPIAARVASRLGISDPTIVQQSVGASAVRNSSLVNVSAAARDPQRAASLANVTAQEFVAYFRETNRAAVSETRRFVEEQLALARAKLDASERALQAFKENRQMPSPSAVTSQMLSAIASAQTELDAAILARREAEARLAAARERLARERPVVVAQQSTADNPVFRRYQDRLVELELQKAQLSQTYTPQHPRMQAIEREIVDVRNHLTSEARTSIAEEVTTSNPIHARLLNDIVTYEVDRAAATARVEALQLTQRQRQAVITSIPAAENEFNRLSREQRVLEQNYLTLSSRYQELLLRENEAGFYPASLQLIAAANPPTGPDSSSFPLAAGAAGAAGLLLGIAGALFLETLDDRIRGAHDAERVLGVPVLAEIPMQGGRRTAPAPAVLVLGILLAASIGSAAAARASVSFPGSAQVRSVVDTVTSWVSNAQQGGTTGIVAGDNR